MSRIFITGDTHGTIDFSKLAMRNFPIQRELNKSDILIICGDSALCWSGKNDDKWLQQWYEDKNFTTFIVDGNHENHTLISKLPIIEKFGGKVHQISNSVFYAIRGEVYNFNGKTFLSFGGADSTDKHLRKEGESWWSGERITEEDLENARRNVKKYDYIDYVITHTGGSEVNRFIGFEPSESDKILDQRLSEIKYGTHYCGHYHVDLYYLNHRIIYDDVCELVDYSRYIKEK